MNDDSKDRTKRANIPDIGLARTTTLPLRQRQTSARRWRLEDYSSLCPEYKFFTWSPTVSSGSWPTAELEAGEDFRGDMVYFAKVFICVPLATIFTEASTCAIKNITGGDEIELGNGTKNADVEVSKVHKHGLFKLQIID
jgi:hypothetical protein